MGNELAEFREWDAEKELSWNLLDYPAHSMLYPLFSALQQLLFRAAGALSRRL